MPNVTLSQREMSILRQWSRRKSPDEELQKLLDTLMSLLDERTGRLPLSDELLAQIHGYAFETGNATCSATFLSVFQRSLGNNLAKK